MPLRVILRLVAAAVLLAAGGAAAQPRLSPPQQVVIFVHHDVDDAGFVGPLVCELSRTLVAPVRARPLDLPLDAELMATPTQLDAHLVAARFRRATMGELGPGSFAFLVVPHDLTTPLFRYVFGASFGSPYNNGVVSTARLLTPGVDASEAGRLAAARAYKIILRYVAQLSGMRQSDGCVLAMPRGLEELDAKPAEFCDGDRTRLVEAGVVRSTPGDACGPTSRHAPPRPPSLAAAR